MKASTKLWQELTKAENALVQAMKVEPKAGLDYRCLSEIEKALQNIRAAQSKISFGGTD